MYNRRQALALLSAHGVALWQQLAGGNLCAGGEASAPAGKPLRSRSITLGTRQACGPSRRGVSCRDGSAPSQSILTHRRSDTRTHG
jgi:hypothetical protein